MDIKKNRVIPVGRKLDKVIAFLMLVDFLKKLQICKKGYVYSHGSGEYIDRVCGYGQ